MRKKKLSIILSVLILTVSILFSGCSPSKQIDKASLAETVAVDSGENGLSYIFFLLSSSDKPDVVSVEADSFEEACKTARKSYIPELSLSKFELFAVNEKIYNECLQKDLTYIAQNPEFSPVSYFTLCDKNTLNNMQKDRRYLESTEEYINLLKNNNREISVNCLSVFNKIYKKNNIKIDVSYITSNEELKAEKGEIYFKNWENNFKK